jgi:hypothetical protein
MDLLAAGYSAALAAGRQCLFIGHRTPLASFRSGMVARGVDMETALQRDQFVLLPASRTYLGGGFFDADRMLEMLQSVVDGARVAGWAGLCGAGEVTWVADGVPGADRVLEYEFRVNELRLSAADTVVCLYEGSRLPASILGELRDVHPLVHTDEGVVINDRFAADAARAAVVPLADQLEPPIEALPCARLQEALSTHADGELPDGRADELRRHLASCPGCRRQLAQHRGLKASLARLRDATSLPRFVPLDLLRCLQAERAGPDVSPAGGR